MCPSGKISFNSGGEAVRAAAKQFDHRRGSRRRLKGKLSPYRCTLCPLWHLTSQEPGKRPQAKWRR